MSTQNLKTPGLLHSSQGRTPKQSKITTTIRLDAALTRQVDEFIKNHSIDFTTFVHISLMNALCYGIQIPAMQNCIEEKK